MKELEQQLNEQFEQLAPKLDFTVSQEQQNKLVGFVMMLNKWNKAYNLSSVRDPSEMMIKHIFDSLVISPFIQKTHYADVGTGPGLPGIILAIMHPDKQFTLIDSLGKRIRFIKQVLHELNISNVDPKQSRVEQVQIDKPFDGVLSRAFASLNDMLHWCEHLGDGQTEFLALKGQLKSDEIDGIPANFSVIKTHALHVPALEGERHLVVIKKTA